MWHFLDSFGLILDIFELILDTFGPVLDTFGPVLADFGTFCTSFISRIWIDKTGTQLTDNYCRSVALK